MKGSDKKLSVLSPETFVIYCTVVLFVLLHSELSVIIFYINTSFSLRE